MNIVYFYVQEISMSSQAAGWKDTFFFFFFFFFFSKRKETPVWGPIMNFIELSVLITK